MHSLAAQLTLPLLICVVLLQPADSQQSDKPTIEPPFGLHVEEVVANLVRKNLERTKALDAYQATRIEPEFGQPAARQRPRFNFGEILPDPDQRPA